MKNRRILLCTLLCAVLVLLLTQTAAVSAALINGLRLCGTALIPSLFPFLVLSRLLVALLPMHSFRWLDGAMARCFGLSGNCFFPLLISFLGGYPVGVSAAVSLYQRGGICREDCERLLPVCNHSGPGFFVGFLGGTIFRSPQTGFLLYGVHVTGALLCLLLFRKPRPSLRLRRPGNGEFLPSPGALFLSAVSESCAAILQISALVLTFSVFPVFLEHLSLPSLPQALLLGSFELTSGCLRLGGLPGAVPAAAFLMGWGGLCVHMQAAGIWLPAGLHARGYLLSKLLHGVFSALLAMLCLRPSLAGLGIAAGLTAICVIFPRIRKKYGRNLNRYAV